MKKGFLFFLIIICTVTFSFAKKKKKKVETLTYISEATYEDNSLVDARIGAKLIEINSLTSNDTFFTSKNILANNNVAKLLQFSNHHQFFPKYQFCLNDLLYHQVCQSISLCHYSY